MTTEDVALIKYLCGGFGTVLAGVAVGLKVLWNRSEECRKEHNLKDARIDQLENRMNSCPVPECALRPRWKPEETATFSRSPGQNPHPA